MSVFLGISNEAPTRHTRVPVDLLYHLTESRDHVERFSVYDAVHDDEGLCSSYDWLHPRLVTVVASNLRDMELARLMIDRVCFFVNVIESGVVHVFWRDCSEIKLDTV